MYVMNAMQNAVINSDFVERFCIVEHEDASLVIASYKDTRPPVTLGRYKDKKEAHGVLSELFVALYGGQCGFTMPDSVLYFEEHPKKDARTKRKGGS